MLNFLYYLVGKRVKGEVCQFQLGKIKLLLNFLGETGLEVNVCGNDSGFIVVVIMMIKNLQNFFSWEQEKEKKVCHGLWRI